MTVGDELGREMWDRMRRMTGGSAMPKVARRFYLQRRVDVNNISGTGRVAEGVQFSDGRVAMRWLSDTPTTTLFDDIDHLSRIHGHGGTTEVVWIDPGT